MAGSEKFWDKVAKSEAKQLDRFDDDYKKTLAAIEKHLKPEHKVLDFACGSGKVTLAIADNVAQVQGIDLSSGMVELAAKRAVDKGLKNASFLHATVDDSRLPEQGYDVVIACNILHLLDDPQAAVNRITTLLKPGGLFIASTGVLGEKRGLLTGLLWLLTKIRILPTMRFYKSDDLKGFFVKDFSIIDSAEWSGTFKDLVLVGRKR